MQENLNLKSRPAVNWVIKDKLWVVGDDGSSVNFDIRGLVVYSRPDGYYISCGSGVADSHEEPHGKDFNPPPEGTLLVIFWDSKGLELQKNGRPTGFVLDEKVSREYIESMLKALEVMGYKSKINYN